MARRTAAMDVLGIELPIVQAPMAGVATPELAAAVSGAGGLGSLGSAALPPEELTRQAEEVRARTDAPFNVNFFTHEEPELDEAEGRRLRERFAPLYEEAAAGEPPDPTVPLIAFDSDRLAALLEIRPAVVSFHFGLPTDDALEAIRGAGCRVIASATTVTEAIHLADAGVDAVIAQGAEAGGHRGSFLVDGEESQVGTMALVPQVVDAVEVPVIAAGGIAEGRGVAAALALGAGAAQMGTAFLRCPESATAPAYRRALAGASSESTTVTRAFTGRPARALRNRVTEEIGSDALPYPAQISLSAPLGAVTGSSGSPGYMAMWAGQAAPLAREMPAADLVRLVAEEAESVLADLGSPGPGAQARSSRSGFAGS